MIAALYVETGGVYYGLDDVDPWDEARDARLYAGPWPVVAHPPCARWCALAPLVESLLGDGYRVGEDGGCFEAALHAVRTWGGVLEHPASSLAWSRHQLPRPSTRGGWTSSFWDEGFSTEVDQAAYGHPARKRTWLYAVGVDLVDLDWRSSRRDRQVSGFFGRPRGDFGVPEARRVRPAPAMKTPPAFRDVLHGLARSVTAVPA